MNILFSSTYYYFPWPLLLAQLVVGVTMVYYGWPKIKDLKKNGEDFNKMGFKPGIFWGTICALLEFFGGLLMIVGLFVPLVAALYGIKMIVGTIWKLLKAEKPFSDYSYDLLILAICSILVYF